MKHEIISEKWVENVLNVSAKTKGLDELLDTIQLQAKLWS